MCVYAVCAGMCMYMLTGVYIPVCVRMSWQMLYVYAGMCMYMLAGVCIFWKVCVYTDRCVYMLAGVVCVCICWQVSVCAGMCCICWQMCIYADRCVYAGRCLYMLTDVYILVCVCQCWKLFVYSGMFLYMLAGVCIC